MLTVDTFVYLANLSLFLVVFHKQMFKYWEFYESYVFIVLFFKKVNLSFYFPLIGRDIKGRICFKITIFGFGSIFSHFLYFV